MVCEFLYPYFKPIRFGIDGSFRRSKATEKPFFRLERYSAVF